MILQIHPEIQDHPYPLQTQNPVQGMDDIAILYKNTEPSMMQNKSSWKSATIRTKNGMAQCKHTTISGPKKII